MDLRFLSNEEKINALNREITRLGKFTKDLQKKIEILEKELQVHRHSTLFPEE